MLFRMLYSIYVVRNPLVNDLCDFIVLYVEIINPCSPGESFMVWKMAITSPIPVFLRVKHCVSRIVYVFHVLFY